MCQFLFIVVPERTPIEQLANLLDKYNFGCKAVDYPKILHQLPKGNRIIQTTKGHCDCGSGIACNANGKSDLIQTKEIEKLRKKGWSETKISLYLENKSQKQNRRQTVDELNRWANFIKEATNNAQIGKVGLYMFSPENDYLEDDFPIAGMSKFANSDISHDLLERMPTNSVYWFSMN